MSNIRIIEEGGELVYPEALPPETEERVHLDLTNTQLELYYESVDLLKGSDFTLIRRDGFGGSDSSYLCNVNPYDCLANIIDQKARKTLTEEERAVSNQIAVIKGNDLEPLIIKKFEQIMGIKCWKPTDMYRFKDFPYLKMNFDGVTGKPEQYFPVEIKVVTKRGERHYNAALAYYTSQRGFGLVPPNHSITDNSIETKAALYGIPPYYYTQLQDEMMALNAPYGYLCTLWESSWTVHMYFIWRDPKTQSAIVLNGSKAWDKVLALREQRGLPAQLFNIGVSNDNDAQI